VKIKPYDELHMDGMMFLENDPFHKYGSSVVNGDFGIQIGEDGRVWICFDGVAFIRFAPSDKYVAYSRKLKGGRETEKESIDGSGGL
jgi:hypothetical protein